MNRGIIMIMKRTDTAIRLISPTDLRCITPIEFFEATTGFATNTWDPIPEEGLGL
jgi:hypothetical protein